MVEITDYISMPMNMAGNSLSAVASFISQTASPISNIITKIKHGHAAHAHPCCHTFKGEGINTNYTSPYFTKCNTGNCYTTTSDPDLTMNIPVYLLMREYSHEIDCDKNGLIFGKDFIFSLNDNNVPKIMFAIQRLLNTDITIRRFTWVEFLKSSTLNIYFK